MNLETQSFNLSSVKNELKRPSENINPYALVYLFERCKKNGSLDDAIRVSKRQNPIWGHNKMNLPSNNKNNNISSSSTNNNSNKMNNNNNNNMSSNKNKNNSKYYQGALRPSVPQDFNCSNTSGSAQRSRRVGEPPLNVSQQSAWSRFQNSPQAFRPTDEKWLLPENIEERFVNVVNLIGDREKYAQNEYVREWLNHRHETSACEMEPILWHVHCYDPPGFILSSSERYDDKMLVDLLRMLRLPFVVRRRRTICIFVDSSQVESIVNKLKSKEISVAVLRREHLPNKSHIPNAVFVATHPRNVGTLPLDNVINCQMFQTVGQYVDRMRLLRRKGHMTTFFNPSHDSKFVPDLVQEMTKRKIDVPAFLKNRYFEKSLAR